MAIAVTLSELHQMLDYDPLTGEFRWVCPPQNMINLKGLRAGSIYSNGYRYISINGVEYRSGRLAWLYYYGEEASGMVDHHNRDRSDDRILNLREATNSQNQANRPAPKNNTSGVKGVRYERDRGRWRASIEFNGKAKNLGRFSTKEEAIAARKSAEEKCFGEFNYTEH